MEEERRLCYVAITRAKQTLTISYARQRMLYGRTNAAMASRFLKEIPESCILRKGGYYKKEQSYGYGQRTAPQKTNYLNTQITAAAVEKSSSIPDIKKGDMVQHAAFGRGMVLSVLKMGGDALLEIAFDQIGTKKLMAKTAFAHMKKLS